MSRLAIISAASAVACALACLSIVDRGTGPFCAPECLDRRFGDLLGPDQALLPGKTATAKALVARELAFSPFDSSAWLRMAALDTDPNGLLSPGSVAALAASYRFIPVDAEVALWRTAFVFGHWSQAGDIVRTSARREVGVLFAQDPDAFVALERDIHDPSGALAYRFLMDDLGAQR